MKPKNHLSFFTAGIFLLVTLPISGFNTPNPTATKADDWCNRPPRPGLEKFKEIKTSRPWFKVYAIGHDTYAIDEPYNWEETIGYLILGKDKALLFDTGMGLDTISLLVKELTKLPVIVLNSHTHPDHIGGNHEFSNVLAMDTRYTRSNAAKGYAHNDVKWEVAPASFCLARLPKQDTARYAIKPFKVSRFIKSKEVIDLGQRKLQVIATPGHTPDAICLYDARAGYLWCGDSFYEGPILLSSDGTDLKAYQQSINKMARLAAKAKWVLPAHNLPMAQPALLIEAAKEFNLIASGAKKGKPGEDHTLTFTYDKFSYQIGEKFMQQLGR
ncbi:MBL fold metallo-hydrolase [Mucilaginibacter psychrotolerans]|uniref:MBL fold metallo-hydrolase n=1 Tax=Mucilaginibacter psychrotolerans TaxID=1524096 RepID=A0A4Y8S3A1_9SPHI|nr:MBL fold metallo-hydrolase [Mucilaginibacter psychrotolerans]TFF33442.1 MBL fold metallo-hydrolase [Mucilaginibacter psychrotolerans]